MIDPHKQFKDNIHLFLTNELEGNDLRRFYFHSQKCPTCMEILRDDYIMYYLLNDLDDENFNYSNSLDDKLKKIYENITQNDKNLSMKYIFYSIFICVVLLLMMSLLIRVVYG